MKHLATLTALMLSFLLLASCGQQTSQMRDQYVDGSGTDSLSQQNTDARKEPATGTVEERLLDASTLSIGKTGAPIVVTLVTHPSCAYCRELETSIVPRLMTDFVDSGRIEFREMILPIRKYPESELVRTAIGCAETEKKGFSLLHALFNLQTKDQAAIEKTAASLGLNESDFKNCLNQPRTNTVENTWLQAHGITLVPTFVIGDDAQVGLPKYADLRGWIESKEGVPGK